MAVRHELTSVENLLAYELSVHINCVSCPGAEWCQENNGDERLSCDEVLLAWATEKVGDAS